MNTRARLSAMMFVQYMIWGSWYPVLSVYLEGRGYSGLQIGVIYSLLPIGCMIAPFAGGQLADRYIATEKLLGVLHLAGGVVLCFAARATDYNTLVPLIFFWAMAYAPTLALSNSITFHHLPDAEKRFGVVRVFGTLGWIAVGLLLSALRQRYPETVGLPGLGGADSLWLGGLLSIALGLFCFALPHTPPAKSNSSPWAFLGVFKLLRDPSFALFTGIAFVVATELMFYYVLTAPFLQSLNLASSEIPAIMTIAQIAEIGTMLLLPWMLGRWGLRRVMALGIIAWPVRYAVFAFGEPTWLIVAALSLHGICYVCFFVVAFIHVNAVAPPDLRASAQAFMTFVTLGAGMYAGSLFAGAVRDYFTTAGADGAQAIDYTSIFLVPCVLTTLCAIVFFFSFKEKKETVPVRYQEQTS